MYDAEGVRPDGTLVRRYWINGVSVWIECEEQ